MSTKVEQAPQVEHGIQPTVTATSSATSTISPKVSMFAAKSGFVIPKNKLSGSLVPIFRGGKKLGGSDAESEESTKQVQRKTKWGPDLTQDASVRRGRALAYQTRVDQITQQLKSGFLEDVDDQDSLLTSQRAGHEFSAQQISSEKSELLELERREAIGEILKLNPSYKAPADYKPLWKEAKVPIPIKEYPGHNFIRLIFGPASDTQKRLEKETGARIRVYGTNADTKKEAEITPSDGNEAQSGYEELYVLVTADTYEKVDAAVSLIELLVTPVSANTVAVSTVSNAVSGDNANGISLSQGTHAPSTISTVLVNQGVAQPFIGAGQAPPLGQFQPYPTQWFPAGPPSGFLTSPFPKSSAPILSNPVQISSPSNPSNMSSLFGPRPVPSPGFGSVPQNHSLVPSRPQPIIQGLQRPYMLQAPSLGYTGPPRNPSLPPLQSTPGQPNFSAPPPFNPNPPTPSGPTQNMRPLVSPMPRSVPPFTFPDRPLTSTGWSQAPSHMPQMVQPMVRPQGPLPVASQPIAVSGGPPLNTTPGNMVSPSTLPFRPSASQSLSIVLPVGPQSGVPNLTPNPVLGPVQFPSPVPSTLIPPPPQLGITTSVSGSAPSFTPIKPPITALKPQQPSSNDFTFQPHRTQTPSSQVIPRPGSQPVPHVRPPQNLTVQPPQSPSFRPGMTNSAPPSIMQGFPRPQVSNQVGQPLAQQSMPAPLPRHPAFPGPGQGPVSSTTPVPQMGPRHFSPAVPQGVNLARPFPPRPGHPVQLQQNYPSVGTRPQNPLAPTNQQFSGNVSFPTGRPASSPSGAQQIYDPFSPTSVSPMPHLAGNPPNTRKQESDPEYDDLMASVGVK